MWRGQALRVFFRGGGQSGSTYTNPPKGSSGVYSETTTSLFEVKFGRSKIECAVGI